MVVTRSIYPDKLAAIHFQGVLLDVDELEDNLLVPLATDERLDILELIRPTGKKKESH